MKGSAIAIALALAACSSSRAQEPAPQQGTELLLRSETTEVLLDLVARDKRGVPVRDLALDELTVLEDGVPQEIVSFRKVEGGLLEGPSASSGAIRPSDGQSAAGPSGQMRMAQLVTLVFERLGNTSRNLAYRAARTFLRNELSDNVFVSVFVLDRSLLPLQEFTNDLALLERAVESATSRNRTDFFAESAEVERRLEQFLQQSNAPNIQQAVARSSLGASRGAPDVGRMLAQRAFEIAERSESMAREIEAGGSIFGLKALVRSLADLSGRKTVLLFSEGFQVPAGYEAHLDGLVNEANRGLVSFYMVDARGLQTGGQLEQAKRMLATAAANSRSQQELSISGAQRGLTQSEIQALDSARASIRGNRQGTMQEIAARTGGMFIGNTNSFAKPLGRVAEDIFSYYEVSYRPAGERFDGSFRAVSIEVGRPDVAVQVRDGYFALPPHTGDIVTSPFEMPMLSQLAADPLPSAIAVQARGIGFRDPAAGTPLLVLSARFPLADLAFRTETVPDPEARRKEREREVYHARFALLAQLRDAAGTVVRRVSQDLPLTGDIGRLDALRSASFRLERTWDVPAGDYILEGVVRDRVAESYGSFRRDVQLGGEDRPALSDLVLIERVDESQALAVSGEGAERPAVPNPLQFRLGRVVPASTNVVSKAAGGAVSYYFVVYPVPGETAKPEFTMEYWLDGQLVGVGEPGLPDPEPDGSIPYIATTPSSAFPPGSYEMRVSVRQGERESERSALFRVVE